MKVFTVGLDQKSPRDDDTISTVTTEKNGPPPSYVSSPVPISYQQPAIIVQRKSRGYKGILLIMLTVFLIALFALTISEIAYNRQRDENFFKLRWAELKHRMGVDNDEAGQFSLFHRNLFNTHQPLEEPLPVPQKAEISQMNPVNLASPSQEKEVQQESTIPPKIIVDPMRQEATSTESSSNSNSNEVEPPNGILSGENSFRDLNPRLDFLRRILQKIKKHAEQMGFDGTMQISVIEVEPQSENRDAANSIERPQQWQRLTPFQPQFLHPFQQQQRGDNRLGDLSIQPQFLQNEIEPQRPRPFNFPPPPPMMPTFDNNWPRVEFPRRLPLTMVAQPMEPSPAVFRPLWNNDLYRQQQQQQQIMNNQQQDNERGEMYGRRFGDLLRNIIANRIQTFQHLQQLPQPQQPQQAESAEQFQSVPIPKQDRPQPEWRTVGINFQNDFFPPPSEQSTEEPKKSPEEKPRDRDTVISGETISENSNLQKTPEFKAGEWLVPKANPEQGKQDQEQPIPFAPKPSENPILIPFGDKEGSKKMDMADSWPAPIKADSWQPTIKTDEQKPDEDAKEPKKGDEQPMPSQHHPQNFPNTAPFFFQVDDPNTQDEQQTTN